MPKDFYDILGVHKKASSDEIKRAYRKLAKDVHPDVNQSMEAATAFHLLNEAYSVLIDKKKREAYDRKNEVKALELTAAEIRELLKKQKGRFGEDYKFQSSSNYYPPTNYRANQKAATILNIVMMSFALTMILDFFISRPLGNYEIKNIKQKVLVTGDLHDFDTYLLATDAENLELPVAALRSLKNPPKSAELRRSLFYGNISFRLSEEMEFIRNQKFVYVTYFFIAIVFIAGSTGLFPQMSAERKFNAAIISSFFSLVILVLLFLG